MKSPTIQVFAVVGIVIGLTMSVRPAAADPPKIITIDAPGAGTSAGQGTYASSINLSGAITGPYVDARNVAHGFLLGADDRFTTFGAPGAGTKAGQGTGPKSINLKGAIAGVYADPRGVFHGFLRAPGGAITTFDAPGAGTSAGQGTLRRRHQPGGGDRGRVL